MAVAHFFVCAARPPLQNTQLNAEEFFVGEPLPRFPGLLQGGGEMDSLNGAAHVVMGPAPGNVWRQAVFDVVPGFVEGDANPAAEHPLGEFFGESVDGNDPAGVKPVFVVLGQQFVIGISQAQTVPLSSRARKKALLTGD